MSNNRRLGLLSLLLGLLWAGVAWAQAEFSPDTGQNFGAWHKAFQGAPAGPTCQIPSTVTSLTPDPARCHVYGIQLGTSLTINNPRPGALLPSEPQIFELQQPLSGATVTPGIGTYYHLPGGLNSLSGLVSAGHGLRDLFSCVASVLDIPPQLECQNPTQAVGAAVEAWNPAQINSNLTLSNSNRTATLGAVADGNYPVFGLVGVSSGKYYTEIKMNYASGSSGTPEVGVGNTSSPTASGNYLGQSTDTIGYEATGIVLYNNTGQGTIATYTTGTPVCEAFDFGNQKIWFQPSGSGQWDNTTDNPSTNTGGFNLSGLFSGATIVPAANVIHAADSAVINPTTPCSFVSASTLSGFQPMP